MICNMNNNLIGLHSSFWSLHAWISVSHCLILPDLCLAKVKHIYRSCSNISKIIMCTISIFKFEHKVITNSKIHGHLLDDGHAAVTDWSTRARVCHLGRATWTSRRSTWWPTRCWGVAGYRWRWLVRCRAWSWCLMMRCSCSNDKIRFLVVATIGFTLTWFSIKDTCVK